VVINWIYPFDKALGEIVPGEDNEDTVSITTGLSLINNFGFEGSKWKDVVDGPIQTFPEEYNDVLVPPISTLLL
jgi:hypothetical protein